MRGGCGGSSSLTDARTGATVGLGRMVGSGIVLRQDGTKLRRHRDPLFGSIFFNRSMKQLIQVQSQTPDSDRRPGGSANPLLRDHPVAAVATTASHGGLMSKARTEAGRAQNQGLRPEAARDALQPASRAQHFLKPPPVSRCRSFDRSVGGALNCLGRPLRMGQKYVIDHEKNGSCVGLPSNYFL